MAANSPTRSPHAGIESLILFTTGYTRNAIVHKAASIPAWTSWRSPTRSGS